MIVAPIIHLNGTSEAALKSDLAGAYLAVKDAREAVAATAPNARDYYPYNDAMVFEWAVQKHHARMKKLKEVMTELHDILAKVTE